MMWFNTKRYYDDRIYVYDLTQTRINGHEIWEVIARLNRDDYPVHSSYEFDAKSKAVEFIKKKEPATPRITLDGRAPYFQLSYEEYSKELKEAGIHSAIEIYKRNE